MRCGISQDVTSLQSLPISTHGELAITDRPHLDHCRCQQPKLLAFKQFCRRSPGVRLGMNRVKFQPVKESPMPETTRQDRTAHFELPPAEFFDPVIEAYNSNLQGGLPSS